MMDARDSARSDDARRRAGCSGRTKGCAATDMLGDRRCRRRTWPRRSRVAGRSHARRRAVAGGAAARRGRRRRATSSRQGVLDQDLPAGRPARAATRGGCRSRGARRSSCSRRSWSTRWRRSCSTPGSSRCCCATPERDKHIVNVSAVEGQFYRVQDHAAPAHQHGEGRAQHDDPHVGGRLPRRRHPHEQRRHRLGDRRGSGRDRRAEDAPSTASIRRSTSSTARPASSTRSSTVQHRRHVWGQFLKDYQPTDW